MKDLIKYFMSLSILTLINSEDLEKVTVKGKCVYIFNDSSVYSFHPLTSPSNKVLYKDVQNFTNSEGKIIEFGWFINICNDTIYEYLNSTKNENGTNSTNTSRIIRRTDSQMVYCDQNLNCTRGTGGFHSDNSGNLTYIVNKTNKTNFMFEYDPSFGDTCDNENSYKMKIKFINNPNEKKPNVHYTGIEPLNKNSKNCNRELIIEMNLEEPTDYLLIQKMFNNYFYVTGPIFFLIGIFLMILAKNKKATKFIIGWVFSEILCFSIACGIFGLSYKYMEFVLTSVGFILGILIGYFSLKSNKFFKVILAIAAGFIFGLLFFDMIFVHGNYQLTGILLADTVLIFIGLFTVIVEILPDFHIFYDSVIGSYVFIRGISILLYKLGGNIRYRELQIILYLVNRYEFDYVNDLYQNNWKYYWVYDIFIFVFMAVSIFYYYIKVFGRDDYEDEEEENPEEKLVGGENDIKNEENEDDQP